MVAKKLTEDKKMEALNKFCLTTGLEFDLKFDPMIWFP
jgi:hypothetical protein